MVNVGYVKAPKMFFTDQEYRYVQAVLPSGEIYVLKMLREFPNEELPELNIIDIYFNEKFKTDSVEGIREDLKEFVQVTNAKFSDDGTEIYVTLPDYDTLTIHPTFLIEPAKRAKATLEFAFYFNECFNDRQGYSLPYLVYNKVSFCFSCTGSTRVEERIRIGSKLKEIRESQGMEAKVLAKIAGIDAANLCRIEQGRYSVGVDILSKIATALDCKIDIVPNE